MFDDERINEESGKIYRKGFVIALIVSLYYAIIKGILIIGCGVFDVKNLIFEITVIVSSSAILLGGLVQGNGDERGIKGKALYFKKAGKAFVLVCLAGYAISVPFSMSRVTVFDTFVIEFPPSKLILMLEAIGVLFFYFNFRKKDINMNYSIINLPKKEYYKRVTKNVLAVSLWILAFFALAAFIEYEKSESYQNLLSILFSCILSLIEISAVYFVLSWIEYSYYNDETDDKVNKGAYIAIVFAACLFTVDGMFKAFNVFVGTNGVSSITDNPEALVNFFTASIYRVEAHISNYVLVFFTVAMGIVFTKLSNQARYRKWFSVLMTALIANEVLGFVLSIPTPLWTVVFIKQELLPEITSAESIIESVSGIVPIIALVSTCVLLHGLKAKRTIRLLPILYVVVCSSSIIAPIYMHSLTVIIAFFALLVAMCVVSIIIVKTQRFVGNTEKD